MHVINYLRFVDDLRLRYIQELACCVLACLVFEVGLGVLFRWSGFHDSYLGLGWLTSVKKLRRCVIHHLTRAIFRRNSALHSTLLWLRRFLLSLLLLRRFWSVLCLLILLVFFDDCGSWDWLWTCRCSSTRFTLTACTLSSRYISLHHLFSRRLTVLLLVMDVMDLLNLSRVYVPGALLAATTTTSTTTRATNLWHQCFLHIFYCLMDE